MTRRLLPLSLNLTLLSPTYDAAMHSKYAEEWTDIIIKEWESLMKNGPWDEVPESDIPVGQKALDGK